MGILGSVLGLDDIIGEVGKTVRQVLPNKEAQHEFDVKMAEMQDRIEARVHEQVLAQVELNKVEAGHASIFVAGWRSAIGWVCAAGLGYNFIIAPLFSTLFDGVNMLNIEGLITLVVTMLGASGIRTFEKVKGVGSDTLASPLLSKHKALALPAAAPLTDEVPTEEENAPWTRS